MPAEHVAAIAVPVPVVVAGEDDVEQVMRTAKAGIAILSLQLRSLEAEAASERGAAGEPAAVEAFLDECLGRDLERRRAEMVAELDRVRSDAARLVLGARASAAELVAQAGEESLGSLLALHDPPRPSGVPSLRVISEAPLEQTEMPVSAPSLVALLPPPTPLDHPAGASAPGTPAPALPIPVPVAAPVAPQPAVITLPEPSTAATAPAPDPASTGSRVSRFLYLDVLLPMVAVLLLVFLLLAWVG